MPAKFNSNISFLDDSLVTEHSLFYTLCLEVGVSGISFTIYHKQKNIFLGLKSFTFSKSEHETELIPLLNQVMQENEWMKLVYSKVIILINNNNSTLVPLALFNEKDENLYLKFNHTVNDSDVVNHDFLRNTQSVNVYSTPEIIITFLTKRWPDAKIIHYSSCIIEALSNQFKNLTDNKTLFLNLREGILDIIYFKNGKLFYYNNFRFTLKEDFAYFLLWSMEQLNLSPEDTKVEISGKISEDSGIYQILHDYVRYHSFLEKNHSYNYSEKMNDEACRQFYVLLNALQCV